jgi:hypothetical protein
MWIQRSVYFGTENVIIFYGHLVYLRQLGISCGHLVNIRQLGIFCGHLVFFIVIWHIHAFHNFGMLLWEKSGNPAVPNATLVSAHKDLYRRDNTSERLTLGRSGLLSFDLIVVQCNIGKH